MIVGAMLALIAASTVPAPQPDTHVVFSDAARNVAIRYEFTPSGVEFSSKLKDGWSFSVAVDGDQNGVWGNGAERAGADVGSTLDRKFGPTSHGALCAQYVLTSDPQDPSDIYSSSLCGAWPSRGTVEMGAADPNDAAVIRLRIPYDEFFGTRPDAHVRICLWDSHQRSCQHSPAEPLILTRPTPAAPAPRG